MSCFVNKIDHPLCFSVNGWDEMVTFETLALTQVSDVDAKKLKEVAGFKEAMDAGFIVESKRNDFAVIDTAADTERRGKKSLNNPLNEVKPIDGQQSSTVTASIKGVLNADVQ